MAGEDVNETSGNIEVTQERVRGDFFTWFKELEGTIELNNRAKRIEDILKGLISRKDTRIGAPFGREFTLDQDGNQAALRVNHNMRDMDTKKPDGAVYLDWEETEVDGHRFRTLLEYYHIVIGNKRVLGVPLPKQEINIGTRSWKAEVGGEGKPELHWLTDQEMVSAWERWLPAIEKVSSGQGSVAKAA